MPNPEVKGPESGYTPLHKDEKYSIREDDQYSGVADAQIHATNSQHIKAAKEANERRHSMTVLMHAVQNGDIALTRWLCEEGYADIHEVDFEGADCTMYAARHNQVEAIEYLYTKCNANIESQDHKGRTPLMYAVLAGNIEMTEWLVAEGQVAVNILDNDGFDVLMLACMEGILPMAEFLIRNADMDVSNSTEIKGETCLMLAAKKGQMEIVQWLVEHGGASPTDTDYKGHPAWRIAGMHGQLDVMLWLCSQGDCDINSQDKKGFTALHAAASCGDTSLVAFLAINLKCDLEATTHNGRTALMEASVAGHLDAVEFLVNECTVELAVEDFDDRSAEMLATGAGEWEIARFLSEGSRTSADDGKIPDWNILMREAERKDISVVEYTRKYNEHGIEWLYEVDKHGRTFLQHAALFGRLNQVKVLVEEANLNIKLKQTTGSPEMIGKTAFDYAIQKKWIEVYLYLFLYLAVYVETDMVALVHKHRRIFAELDKPMVNFFVKMCLEVIEKHPHPVILSIKAAIIFRTVGEVDAINFAAYEKLHDRFINLACKCFDNIPSQKLMSLVLEEPDSLGETLIDLALQENLIEFLGQPTVARVVESWWSQDELPKPTLETPEPLFRSPKLKLILYYCGFIVFLFIFCIICIQKHSVYDSIGTAEVFFFLFTAGYCVAEIQALVELGYADYVRDMWNIIDWILALDLLLIFFLRVGSADTRSSLSYSIETTDAEDAHTVCMSIAALMFWIRAFELFETHAKVGPLLISVRQMAHDIFIWSIILAVLFAGFFFAVVFVIGNEPDDATDEYNISGYQNIAQTILSLWNVVLGSSEYSAFNSLPQTREILAHLLSIAMIIISSIVLVNLLIAMMASTYEEVRAKADLEYRFALVSTRRRFDRRSIVLPTPFNLISFPAYCCYKLLNECKPEWFRKFDRESCAFCHYRWTNDPVNLNRPLSGKPLRFERVTVEEVPPDKAGIRLCGFCLRTKNIRSQDQVVQEFINLHVLKVCIWLPLYGLSWITTRPCQYLRSIWYLRRLGHHHESITMTRGPERRVYTFFDPKSRSIKTDILFKNDPEKVVRVENVVENGKGNASDSESDDDEANINNNNNSNNNDKEISVSRSRAAKPAMKMNRKSIRKRG